MGLNVLLISAAALKERSGVHLNVDDKLILPEIKYAQDTALQEAIGSDLLTRLQTGVKDDMLTADETTLLEDYVYDVLIHAVLRALPMSGSFQFYNKGVQRAGDAENQQIPSMQEMGRLSEFYEKRMEFYRERLIRYIASKPLLFSQYAGTDTTDIKPAKSGYVMQCYLPDDDERC